MYFAGKRQLIYIHVPIHIYTYIYMMGALTFSCSFVNANFCCVLVVGGKKAAHTHTCIHMYIQIFIRTCESRL